MADEEQEGWFCNIGPRNMKLTSKCRESTYLYFSSKKWTKGKPKAGGKGLKKPWKWSILSERVRKIEIRETRELEQAIMRSVSYERNKRERENIQAYCGKWEGLWKYIKEKRFQKMESILKWTNI